MKFSKKIAPPYCLRPVMNACVSAPLDWSEVTHTLSPQQFTIKNILHRLETQGDIFKCLLKESIDIESSIKKAHKFV